MDGFYKYVVVVLDVGFCLEIGWDILKKGGFVMDLVIVVLFCVGVYNMYFVGVGGGGFMVVYNKSMRFVEVIDFCEEVLGKVIRMMYVGGVMSFILGELYFLDEKWFFVVCFKFIYYEL